MEKLGKLFIVLPVHNRKEVTLHFFKQLSNQTFQNYQAILIDDGSKDGTSTAIKEYFPSTVIIPGDGNLWWGGSLHKAYQWIQKNLKTNPKEDAVLIINDDTFFESTAPGCE